MIRIAECARCGSITLNPLGARCACGGKLGPVTCVNDAARVLRANFAAIAAPDLLWTPSSSGKKPTEAAATKRAAVALLQRPDGRLLCVWNKRYRGWTLPGGLEEDSDVGPAHAVARELREETGIDLRSTRGITWRLVHEGPTTTGKPNRATQCAVFLVEQWRASWLDATEQEPGCPVTWLTPVEFLKWSPFRDFYAPVFDMLERRNCGFTMHGLGST